MSKIYTSIDQLVGNTPLLELSNYEKEHDLKATVLAKLEYLNPAGSVKDRIAKEMIDDAERKGILKEGSVIIEPTSGNTGIGLASIAAARGYRIIIVMPETMIFSPLFILRSRKSADSIISAVSSAERIFCLPPPSSPCCTVSWK